MPDKQKNGKTPSESSVVMRHAPMPTETNTNGTLHGGDLLKHIDTAGGMAAWRHARNKVVTVALERMDFRTPVFMGELLSLEAVLHRTGRTSMDVGVTVEAENLTSGETRHVASCFLTYVSIDDAGNPVPVPPLLISTPQEEYLFKEAEKRRAERLTQTRQS